LTFQELKDTAARLLNDPGKAFYSDVGLGGSVNAANNAVNGILLRLQPDHKFLISATRDTVSATKSYALPADSEHVSRIERIDNANPNLILDVLNPIPMPTGTFPHSDRESYQKDFSLNGVPTHYLLRKTQIDLYPTPDAVYRIRIWFDQRAAELGLSTDVPACALHFHYWIACEAGYLSSFQNPVERRDDLHALYLEHIEELIALEYGRGGNLETLTMVGMFETNGGFAT
jgi:hypothetical protein